MARSLALLLVFPAIGQTLTSADYVQRASQHLKAGQAQLAVDEYSQAIRLRLDSDKAWTGRGRAYNSLGNYSAAIDDFDQAARLNPANVEAYVERGFAYGRIGRFSDAIQN